MGAGGQHGRNDLGLLLRKLDGVVGAPALVCYAGRVGKAGAAQRGEVVQHVEAGYLDLGCAHIRRGAGAGGGGEGDGFGGQQFVAAKTVAQHTGHAACGVAGTDEVDIAQAIGAQCGAVGHAIVGGVAQDAGVGIELCQRRVLHAAAVVQLDAVAAQKIEVSGIARHAGCVDLGELERHGIGVQRGFAKAGKGKGVGHKQVAPAGGGNFHPLAFKTLQRAAVGNRQQHLGGGVQIRRRAV